MSLSPASQSLAAFGPWLAGAVALIGYLFAALPARTPARWPAAALGVGWAAHAVALVLDVGGVGDPLGGPRFGFAPALSVTAWLVLAVHGVESRFVPLPAVRRTLALIGAAVVVLAAAFPGDIRVSAHLSWLPLHWLLGIASYGLFGAAVLHAGLLDAAERKLRFKAGAPLAAGLSGGGDGAMGLPLLRLERLTFRFVDAGFVVLSAALSLGLWATARNPSLWHWDHKTVFSLLGWATFAALIVGRRVQGWRGRRATRWLYAGAALLVLAYVGSRFVLEVLLGR